VALDLSHASDALAREALEHLDATGNRAPVLASHSNYRAACDHARNLPDDLASEIIRRGGVIGLNFIRDYVHESDPRAMRRHVEHALELGGGDALAFGADFFAPRQLPVPREIPFFFTEHEHAGRYPPVLRDLHDLLGDAGLAALAHGNVERFLRRVLDR
jgi:microsomal dipeptidase-like Zn-dependent dipeptidase